MCCSARSSARCSRPLSAVPGWSLSASVGPVGLGAHGRDQRGDRTAVGRDRNGRDEHFGGLVVGAAVRTVGAMVGAEVEDALLQPAPAQRPGRSAGEGADRVGTEQCPGGGVDPQRPPSGRCTTMPTLTASSRSSSRAGRGASPVIRGADSPSGRSPSPRART